MKVPLGIVLTLAVMLLLGLTTPADAQSIIVRSVTLHAFSVPGLAAHPVRVVVLPNTTGVVQGPAAGGVITANAVTVCWDAVIGTGPGRQDLGNEGDNCEQHAAFSTLQFEGCSRPSEPGTPC